MNQYIEKALKFLKLALKTAKLLFVWLLKKTAVALRRFKGWFLKLETQHQALFSLGIVFIIGLIGLAATLSGVGNSSTANNAADIPKEPQREIFFTCTDTEITPAETSISAKEFIRFRFKNEGSDATSFGLRAKEGTFLGLGGQRTSHINSTIAIAPNTIASFAWRIPADIKGKTIESYCSQGGSEITGTVKFAK